MQEEKDGSWLAQLRAAQANEADRRMSLWKDLVNELKRHDASIDGIVSFRCDRDVGVLMSVDGFKVRLSNEGTYIRDSNKQVVDLENMVRIIRYNLNAKRWRDIAARVEKEVDVSEVKRGAVKILNDCQMAKLRLPDAVETYEDWARLNWTDVATCLIHRDEGIVVDLYRPTVNWAGSLSLIGAEHASTRLIKKVPLYSADATA